MLYFGDLMKVENILKIKILLLILRLKDRNWDRTKF